MRLRKQTLAALVSAALIGAASGAGAQQPGGMMGAQGADRGMMGAQSGGTGPGMMSGAQSAAPASPSSGATSGAPCPGYAGGGYGMGPGMMGGGYGMGPGMMGGGGYGMGSGMMGMMMGPGMMGGAAESGMGPGMMGYGPLQALNLSDEQRSKIGAIQEELQRKFLDLGDKAAEQTLKMRQLWRAEKPDRKAIAAAYRRLQEVRQEGFDARLDAREKIEGALTTEQRQQLRRWGPAWMMN